MEHRSERKGEIPERVRGEQGKGKRREILGNPGSIAAGFAIEQPAAMRSFYNAIMKQIFTTGLIFAAFIYTSLAADLNTARIDELTGLKGKMNEKEGVYKVTFPRGDVKVVVDGWRMPPFMGLGTWAAFTKGVHTEAMVMGDTVLFEDEVSSAMSAALDNGLQVTALHNHFFFDRPKVFFMHIEGEGGVDDLARAVKKLYDTTKAIRGRDAKPAESFAAVGQESPPEKNSINATPLNGIFGMQGEAKDGMVK